MPVPGVPGADLVVVESDFVLPGSEAFLDWPACPGDEDHVAEAGAGRIVAMVESEFTVVDGPAGQVLVVGVGRVGKRPVVDPEPFRADTAGAALPGVRA